MRKLLPILLSALMFTGCAGTSNNPTSTYRRITMDEAVTMMAQETGYIILDVRTQEEYDQGHIPGAILIPDTEIKAKAENVLAEKNQTETNEEIAKLRREVSLRRKIAEKIIIRGLESKCR